MIAFFRVLPEYGVDLFPNKKNKVTPELAAQILPAARDALEKVQDWTPEDIDAALHGYIETSGYKLGTVMWPLRIALSGRKVTPGGVTELLYLLGQKESLERIGKAISML